MNSTKTTVKFLQGAGVYAFFQGSKNVGSSNTDDIKKAVKMAAKKFPGTSVIIKDFYR